MTWYSGMCRRLCLIDGKGAVIEELSVYVFRATTDKGAFRRFLEIARSDDKEYVNAEGDRVRWAVVSLETLDELTEGQLRDTEVFSKWTNIEPTDRSISFSARFQPEKSKPGSSGVALLGDLRERKRTGATPARRPRRAARPARARPRRNMSD
jgi:hypothetical protein